MALVRAARPWALRRGKHYTGCPEEKNRAGGDVFPAAADTAVDRRRGLAQPPLTVREETVWRLTCLGVHGNRTHFSDPKMRVWSDAQGDVGSSYWP